MGELGSFDFIALGCIHKSIGSLTSLVIHEYVYFIEIKLFKNYSNFNIEVN